MNLIITCARHMEPEASREIAGILEQMGDSEPAIRITEMPGILTVQTGLDPFMVVRKTGQRLAEEPWHVRYCLRLIPIQQAVKTQIDDIADCVRGISGAILENDTYKISVKKRNSDISGQELISRIAGTIPNKVSLETPDKTILIEILAGMTGVSIVQKNDVLSAEKVKRSLSE